MKIPDKKRIALYIASLGGIGFLPLAPGTWASIVGCCVLVPLIRLVSAPLYWIILACFTLVGWWASEQCVTMQDTDPSWIVIDEFVGMGVALGALLRNSSVHRVFSSWSGVLFLFFFFRFFDILKPWPVSVAERLNRGAGVLADDIVAGLLAAGLFFVFYV